MKHMTKLICVMLICAALLPGKALAAEYPVKTEEMICFEDGSYITVEISVMEERSSTVKRGNKTYVYRSNDGTEEWRAVLYGTFTYTGTTSTCTAASSSVTISDSRWYVVSETAGKNGRSAVGELTMGRKWLGITVDKETVNMRITCDANGNLS